MTEEEQIRQLVHYLLMPAGVGGKRLYELARSDLIEQHGYSKFRDLQCRAFEVALFGHEIPKPACTCEPGAPMHSPRCPHAQS